MASMMAANMRDMSHHCQRDMSRSPTSDVAGIIPHMFNNMIDARIRDRLKAVGKTAPAVLREAGLGRDVLRDIGRKPILPRLDTLIALAAPLRTTPEWLAFGQGIEDTEAPTKGVHSVPLVSWVAASGFAEVPSLSVMDDEWPKIQAADLPPGRYIALRVEGDSMNKIAVDQSLILVRVTDRALVDRGFYIFQGPDGATFKRYRDREGPVRIEPYSTNDSHPIIYPTAEVEPIGRVFRVITDLYAPQIRRA